MEHFLEQHREHIVGVLSGYDRVLFRGSLRSIDYPEAFGRFLSSQRVLIKNFAAYSKPITDRIKEEARSLAESLGRPFQVIESSNESKEQVVKELLERNPLSEGLICVLQCTESCRSIDFRLDPATKWRYPVFKRRRCAHLYFYFLDPDFGLCHVRLQTWFPFSIQVCVNGREWLAKRLQAEGISFEKVGNSFTAAEDFDRLQELMDEFHHLDWISELNRFAQLANYLVRKDELCGLKGYYWTMRQSEVATDILFDSPEYLQAIYPHLVRYSFQEMHARDVIGYLQGTSKHPLKKTDRSLKEWPEGRRVKFWVQENSIKMYDKADALLRIETTINNPDNLKVWRTPENSTKAELLNMRRGIADCRARYEFSRAANYRFLNALAVVGSPKPSSQVLDRVTSRIQVNGRSYRGLRPLDPLEAALFKVLIDGSLSLLGIANKDIRKALYPTSDPDESRRISSRVSRHLAMLRAHKLLERIPKRNRYRPTPIGYLVMATALRIRETDLAILAA